MLCARPAVADRERVLSLTPSSPPAESSIDHSLITELFRFDAGWLNTYRTQVDAFLRDILNPSPEDPYFPVTRNRDWFAGHSWGEKHDALGQ